MSVFPYGLGAGIPSQIFRDPYPVLDLINPTHWGDWGKKSNKAAWPTNSKWAERYIPHMYSKAEPHRGAPFAYDNAHGKAWQLFNEPNQSDQGYIDARSAAREAWRIWNYGAKRLIVGNCIIARETEFDHRIAWFSAYVHHRGPLPECWGIHLYDWDIGDGKGGDEISKNGVKAKIHRFEKWIKARDGRKPAPSICVTEVSAGAGSVELQKRLLWAVKGCLNDGDMMAASWFSGRWRGKWSNSDLIDSRGQLTEVGQVFKA